MSSSSRRYCAFLSYAHRYQAWVQAFQQDLEASLLHHGADPHEVFLDSVDLGSGRSWVTQLEAGIDQAENLILVVTPEALASPRVGDERNSFIATRRDWLLGNFHLVRLVDAPLPPFLAQVQWVDFTGSGRATYEEALKLLVGALLDKTPREARELTLPASLEGGTATVGTLDPTLRSGLVKWLAPRLSSRLHRNAVCMTLGVQPGRVENHPTGEMAASALLVETQGADAPAAAALRVTRSLIELFEEDEPALIESLRELRLKLEAARSESPEAGLLATYLQQVATDHDRLVPYFQQQAEMDLLDRVYVQLSLKLERDGRRMPRGGSQAEKEALLGTGPSGIRDVLALTEKEMPGVTHRWVILGDPGAGKTTLVRHLAAQLARQEDRPWVPVLDSLPRMVREQGFLLERITRRLRKGGHDADALPAVLGREAQEGRLLVLLDGLDEVPKEDRGEAEALLRDLSARWPATPIVVTSRPIGYRSPGSEYRELELLPLDRERRREFLGRWFGRHEDREDMTRAESALRHLEADPDLWELTGNPLYLTLVALLLEEGTAPAPHRPSLYDQVFELLLSGKHKPEPQPMEHPEAVRAMLRHLGFCMTGDNLDFAPEKTLVSRLYEPEADELRDALERVPRWRRGMDAFLEDLGRRTGILGPHDGPDSDWRFWHRTFREALAAEELAVRWKAGKKAEVMSHAKGISGDESRWAEPYALLVGQVEEPDALVRALVKENRALGLRALATAQGLQEETITEVLELTGAILDDRGAAILRIPALLGEAERSCQLLDRLRRKTRDGNELYFLYEALGEINRLYPKEIRRVDALRVRFFNHIPPPPPGLFQWIETPSDGSVFLWREIPAGEFWMGSPAGVGQADEKPRHWVKVLSSFAIGVVPVTNVQYSAFDPSKEVRAWPGVSKKELRFHPRLSVTWYEAVSFCRWLSLFIPGARLPTETEWEYACRAGTDSRYWSGNEESDLRRVGWYEKNSQVRTHRVGEKAASPWGLYDIHGGVLEWTSEPWSADYSSRKSGVNINPKVPPDPQSSRAVGRVVRGGSWLYDADSARSSYRDGRGPRTRRWYLGFRVMLPAVPEL